MRTITYIYALVCPISDEIRYIGKANDPKKRFCSHLIDKRINHKNAWILSLKKQDRIPVLEILDQVSINEWEFWEQYYISLYKSFGFKLTNKGLGGEGMTCHRPEVIKSFLGEKNPMFGKKRPDLCVIAQTRKGKTYEEIYGTQQAIDIRNKISSGKGRPPLSEQERKTLVEGRRKKINQLDLNGNLLKEWDSLRSANNSLSKTKSCASLSRCLKNKKPTAYGYKWEYNTVK